MAFSPKAEKGEDSTSSQTLYCLGLFWRVLSFDWKWISSHSIVACHGREGGGDTFSRRSAQFVCASDEDTLLAQVRGFLCCYVRWLYLTFKCYMIQVISFCS